MVCLFLGCVFGGARYDIDSQWHPILEPYGVMHCLKCTCEAVIKKGLLQQRGQVQCRRISHECPDVSSCPLTAMLPPSSCCKICPHHQEFSAFVLPNLTSILIKGKNGVTIYEENIRNKTEQLGQTLKICSIWRDVSNHIEAIKSNEAHLIITSGHAAESLSGFVKETTPRVLETFSSMLTNAESRGYAASLYMGVVLSNNELAIRGSVVAPRAAMSGKHLVTMEILRDRRVLFTKEEMVAFSSYGTEFHTKWESLSTSSLKQLGRGRLTTRLTLSNGITLSGSITVYHKCGRLNALVTGQDAVPKYKTLGVASAQFNLSLNGQLSYQIEVKDIESKITEIMIETDRSTLAGGTKITRLVRELNEATILKVRGLYDKTDGVIIQQLLEGKLFINIQTRLRLNSTLRGQILLVPSVHSTQTLMVEGRSGVAALSWCDSSNCDLACDLLVPRVAVRRDASTQAFLQYWNQKQLLATFTETNLMEVYISKMDVLQIGSTLPMLSITTRDSTLYGQASIPETCFENSSGYVLPASDQQLGSRGAWVDTPLDLAHKCRYDKKIYSDGESWKPKDSNLACVTCSCKRNKAQCHPVICPAAECASPVTLPGECCPACPKATDNTSKTCFFPGDHRDHAVGTVWHPFMHPGGYFKCAVCFCKNDGDGYDCKQTACPALSCSERYQEVLPGECCPSSSTGVTVLGQGQSAPDLSRMQGDSDSYSSCTVGDLQYANGESFNPEIATLGMYGKVVCTCNNGKLDCKPIECDCSKKISRKNRCCMRQCGFTESDMIRKRRKKDKNKMRDLIC
ncbi:CHRD [Bugula neritina]|uniref:CHRD n=1 Tax=Bugula neritina TaxID=10212 RepID=A0A7J7JBI9_BUGNE|nr:CHRD [Bugula neritina]